MIRAVLDTNILVSGLGWSGVPGQVVEAALAGRFELVTSPALLEEFRRVLSYPKLAEVVDDPQRLVELLAVIAQVVEPAERVDLVADEADNRVIEAPWPATRTAS